MSKNLRYGISGGLLTAAVLAGALAVIPVMAQANDGKPVPSAATGAPAAAKAAPAPAPARVDTNPGRDKPAVGALARPKVAAKPRWAGSTQFQEVKSGTVRGGRVVLLVRGAKKEQLGEGFRTVPVPGPFFEVTLTAHARILQMDGESGIPETFVTDLARRSPNRPNHVTPDERQEGFNLTYDKAGRVTQVEWLYVP
jgi:hypothetical protein